MKYAITRQDGITEVREDDYGLPNGAMQLNDEQYYQLIGGAYILQNGQIVINPNPPRTV
jgi:hypothetical protein